MSLTVSLIAVLIPLLFMADIVGRLFREFAVTLAVTIIFSAFVSLTLTPMMAARILKTHAKAAHGRFYRWSEWCFEQVHRSIRTDAPGGASPSGRDASGRDRHAWADDLSGNEIVPKGFFPPQDTGAVLGISQAPETVSFAAMSRLQRRLVDVIRQDPAVENLTSFIGADGVNTAMNSGRVQITLKPLEDARQRVGHGRDPPAAAEAPPGDRH